MVHSCRLPESCRHSEAAPGPQRQSSNVTPNSHSRRALPQPDCTARAGPL